MKKKPLSLGLFALILAAWSCGPTIPANVPPSQTGVSGSITEDTTWSENTYVSGNVDVYGNLTIAPGVTVTLAKDAEICVYDTGNLAAVGTAERPIVFKAATDSGWSGIYFTRGARGSELEYCDVSGAGSRDNYAIACSAAGYDQFTVKHCVIHDNAKGGIDAQHAAAGTGILQNRFYGNAEFPAIINENASMDSTNAFAKAGEIAASSPVNCVRFTGDISSGKDMAFDITEVPYFNESSIEINGRLAINAGVTVWMGNDAFIDVGETGSLVANGTQTKGVRFAPRRSTDVWKALYFYSGSRGNALSYCAITGCGADSAFSRYALEFESRDSVGVQATLDHCSLYGNAMGGIHAEDSQDGISISSCSFGDNGDSASGPYDIYYDGTGVTVTDATAMQGATAVTTN